MAGDSFEINADNFDDFDGFIREFNRVSVSDVGSEWNGNLDAFNDYLNWPEAPYVISWRKSWKSRRDLGYEATIAWYLRQILDSDPPSKSGWWGPMEAARKREDPTVYDWLVEIIADNSPHATLEPDDDFNGLAVVR